MYFVYSKKGLRFPFLFLKYAKYNAAFFVQINAYTIGSAKFFNLFKIINVFYLFSNLSAKHIENFNVFPETRVKTM